MIPKIIHYCWISGEESMPQDIKYYISTWKKYLPDYEFINWNDSNFNWNISTFSKLCREHNSYAFCADYVRIWAIYNYGGFYLDTDVEVFKSFNDLLDRQDVFHEENCYSIGIEAAIFGAEKHHPFLKDVLDYYNSLDYYMKENEYYEYMPSILKRINEEKHHNIELLPKNQFTCEGYAQHQFKGSWFTKYNHNENNDVGNKDKVTIFIAAHKPFDAPNLKETNNLKYKIISQSLDVKNNKHEVIYINNDEFTKKHNICYSEGCAIRYMYNHPEILTDIVGLFHYRRYLSLCVDYPTFVSRHVHKHGCVVMDPYDHYIDKRKTNKGGMYSDHPTKEAKAFIDSVKEVAPEYWDTFQQLLEDNNQYACNLFIMKKEHFLEMAEMCFRVLDYYDKKQGFKNNKDVLIKILNYEKTEGLKFGDIVWQSRLQGFWLEWLTELYYRHKFGIDLIYTSSVIMI